MVFSVDKAYTPAMCKGNPHLSEDALVLAVLHF